MEYLDVILLGAFLLFAIWSGYQIATVKYRLTKVKEEGIKIGYDNIFLWDNYISYYSKKYGEDKAKELTYEDVSSHDYLEMLKENEVYIREHDEDSMLINWEYVKKWQVKPGEVLDPIGGKGFGHSSRDMGYIQTFIADLPIPLTVYILIDPIDKKITRFKKMVGDKEF